VVPHFLFDQALDGIKAAATISGTERHALKSALANQLHMRQAAEARRRNCAWISGWVTRVTGTPDPAATSAVTSTAAGTIK
jgi:hypothetical protein